MTIEIEPTNGRQVWYFAPHEAICDGSDGRGLAATVCHVHGMRMVNLQVLDPTGNAHRRTSVVLVQEGDEPPHGSAYCAWMPFQLAQAKKHQDDEPHA